jgi:hypothetical protein
MAKKAIPELPDVKGADREQLAAWFKERFEEIDRAAAERIELLRTTGEHPSPIFAKLVRNHGALGMPKPFVAKMLGITLHTVNTFYSDDYDIGAAEMLSEVATNMLRIATSTTDPAASKVGMDILGRRLGRVGTEWAPSAQKVQVEDQTPKGPVIDSSNLTREEREQLRLMLERVAKGGEGEPQDPTDEVIGE